MVVSVVITNLPKQYNSFLLPKSVMHFMNMYLKTLGPGTIVSAVISICYI